MSLRDHRTRDRRRACALERLVHPGKISLARMVELFTTGPARVLNLNRGRIAVGDPGDVTILDLERQWTYDVNRSASKSRNSPFRRSHIPRRPGSHDRQWPDRVDGRRSVEFTPLAGSPTNRCAAAESCESRSVWRFPITSGSARPAPRRQRLQASGPPGSSRLRCDR